MPVVGLAVRVTDVPLQIIPSSLAVPEDSVNAMVGEGRGFTVIETEAEAEQAVEVLVIVTE
jgi:ribosomal protein L13E